MLEKLRSKPSHIKQIISVLLTIVLSSGILFVWLSSWDARANELKVRESTVSPVDGVTSMFDGFASGLKERMSEFPSFGGKSVDVTISTSTDSFDFSGVVVIDPSATTTVATSSKPRL